MRARDRGRGLRVVAILLGLGGSVEAQPAEVPLEAQPAEPLEAQPPEAPVEAAPAEEDDPALEAAFARAEGEGELGAQAVVRNGTDAPDARAASDFHLDPDAYRIVPRRTSDQLLTLAPGVVLANHGGIGHAATVYLRGFDAGEGQDIAYEVDGAILNEPSNPHGHGYADPSFLPVEIVRRVLVREGPFDPRQPSYSVAGSVRYELGTSERGLRFGLRYGSFRTLRALAVYAPQGEREGTFVAVDAIRGDGFGPNRAHASLRAVARLEREVRGVTYSLLGASSAQRFDAAGVVPEAAYRARTLPCGTSRDAQFFCTLDPNQGGSDQRHLLLGRIALDRRGSTFEQMASLMLRDDRFRDDFTGVATSPLGDGLDQRYRAITAMLRGAYRMHGRFLGAGQTFELGYLARHDEGRTAMDRVRFGDGIPRAQVFDSDLRLTEIAAHALADLSLTRFLTLQGGLRLEGFAASVTHHGLPTSDREGPRLPSQTIDAFGLAVSPRGLLSIHPHPTLDVVLAAGLGTRPIDAQGLSDGENAPFTRVTALELGVRHHLHLGDVALGSRAAAFATDVADDLVFDASAGRNVSVGQTVRYGAMVSSQLGLAERFDAQAAFTWSEARRPGPGAGAFALGAGARMPFVPRFVGRLDLAYHDRLRIRRQELRVSAGAGATFVGRKPLPYDQLSSRIAVVDAGAELRYRFVAIELLVENLFDARYRSYELQAIADFSPVDGSAPGTMRSSRLFAAGAPRTIFVTVSFFVDPSPLTETSE